MSIKRAMIAVLGLALVGGSAGAKKTPGVTATEIKIGQTMPYSGPASAYGTIGRAEVAYFKMVNDKGGIGGKKIDLRASTTATARRRRSSRSASWSRTRASRSSSSRWARRATPRSRST